jgi:acyl-CoA thioesterase-1
MKRASGFGHRLAYGAARGLNKAACLTAALLAFATASVAQEITIAALGDSLTQGFGLPQEQGFVPQLQAWLQDRGHDVTIINAGVSGDTTAGGLSRVGWTLTPEVDGMIVALGGNDLLRGIDPENSRENLRGILEAAAESKVEVLLVGLQAPGNYGPEYKAAFDSIYPDLARTFDTLYVPSFLAGLTDGGEQPSDLGRYLQADGLHPNAEGVARIVDALGPQVETLIGRIESQPE